MATIKIWDAFNLWRGGLLVLVLLWVCPALAQQPLTLDEAVTKVSKETQGRVLIAERSDEDGKIRYKIKLLTEDGTVKLLYVDPETGKVEN